MSKEVVEKIFRRKYASAQKGFAEETTILDQRFRIMLDTKELIPFFRLSNRVQPVLAIPLAFNSDRGVFEIIEAPSVVTSQLQGYYYTSPPSETVAGWYNLRVDAEHRLLAVQREVESPGGAELFTVTPLGPGASYFGPSRDFAASRLTTFGVMGYADQASASNGVYVQLSHDNLNWDYQGATATLSGAGAVSLAQVVTARYARVVWVNGGAAQTVFRLGGRYMISGSENPPLSRAPPLSIDPVCSVCNRDMSDTSDFFMENGKVYCPKCYGEKRWKEVKEKAAWLKSLRAWLKVAKGEERGRAMLHIPDEAKPRVI